MSSATESRSQYPLPGLFAVSERGDSTQTGRPAELDFFASGFRYENGFISIESTGVAHTHSHGDH